MYEPFAITEIRTETRNTKTFVLRPTNVFRYDAGQFLTLVFPKPDGEARRNYSFSSTPGVDDLPAITVKRIDNGEFSRRLFDYAAVGDTLLTVGAFGFFALPEKLPKRLFFLAAGSGIAPVFSLIKSLLHQHAEQEIVLIYSNRSPEETIFFEELNSLKQQFEKRFVLEYLFSTASDLSRARLGKALLERFVTQYAPDKHNTLFYICGPFDYMRMANVVLLAEGVPDDHIRRENFVVHKPVIKALPPDTDSHTVTIGIAGNTYTLKTQFPETILEQAKKQAIPIPYSCESGQCGTCAATCTQGHVWMSYNEVLTDNDLKQGRVLTCTGVPYGGDVVLEV